MPEILQSALSTDGLIWIALGSLLAGLVRGFAGFGSAMIYLPFASQFLSPVHALVTLAILDSIGALPAIPRAVREADWPDLRRLMVALVVGLPFGLWLLLSVPQDVFRFGVSFVSLLLLIALVLGLRYQGRLSPTKIYGVGASAGVLGGAVGLPGPPVILLYMASTHSTAVIRATTMIFLFSFDVILTGMLGIQGVLTVTSLMLGALMIVPMMLGIIIGTWLFRPSYEKVYRSAAYLIIAVSAIRGFPFWG